MREGRMQMEEIFFKYCFCIRLVDRVTAIRVLVESCHVSGVVAKRDTRAFPARISAHFILASAHGARQLKERTFEANANRTQTVVQSETGS